MSAFQKMLVVVAIMLSVSGMVVVLGLRGNEDAIIAEQRLDILKLQTAVVDLVERVDVLEEAMQELALRQQRDRAVLESEIMRLREERRVMQAQ